MGKTALVVGATGAVGREIAHGLCEDENYDKIIVWARRELNFSHEKLETQIIDFDEIKDMPPRRQTSKACKFIIQESLFRSKSVKAILALSF